jgi:uncharacterized membrane protein YesL
MAAFRTLWTGFVGLYEDTLPFVGGNVAALVLNLPVALAMFLVGLAALPLFRPAEPGFGGENSGVSWLVVGIAWLLPFLPTPGNVALAGLTRVATSRDVPRFEHFRQALRLHWRIALRCTPISVLVFLGLVWNVGFYATLASDWLRFVSIVWLYGTLFWLSLHLYLVPLMVHVVEPRVLDLYKRSAFIALGHFGYTLVVVGVLLTLGLLTIVFVPIYVLVGSVFINLVQSYALREIRRRHGDLVVEVDEEVSRL